jgi:hypothetical protein
MFKLPKNRYEMKRGILFITSGSDDMLICQKNGVIRLRVDSKKKKHDKMAE